MLCKTCLCAGLFVATGLFFQDSTTTRQEGTATVATQDQAVAAPKVDLEGIKCVVRGEKGKASADHAVAYRDGQVYLCCAKCVEAFNKDPDSYAAKSNHQLVLTGQYAQTGCPISGGEVSAESKLVVAGVEVGFCCDNCKGKVDAEKDATAQAALVFGNEAFEKGFAKKASAVSVAGMKCFFMVKKDLLEDKFVEFNGGKVFFCCDSCIKRFNKDPEKYAAKANQQLVQTGQYAQKGCPISGADVDPEQSVEINGVKVAFCCANCKGKAEAADEDARAELAFGAEAFARGFAKK